MANTTQLSLQCLLDYLGHESVSSYTVSGNVAGTDGQYWNVEVWDESIENWTTPFAFEFGLDSNNSTTYDNLLLRITPANQSTAQYTYQWSQRRYQVHFN